MIQNGGKGELSLKDTFCRPNPIQNQKNSPLYTFTPLRTPVHETSGLARQIAVTMHRGRGCSIQTSAHGSRRTQCRYRAVSRLGDGQENRLEIFSDPSSLKENEHDGKNYP